MANRNETPTEVTRVAPSWLVKEAEKDKSLTGVDAHKRVPMIKCVQAMSADEIKGYGEGAIVTAPGNQLLAAPGEVLQFVPLFMFEEYCKWSDLDDKDSPMILERSFWANSDIAIKAKDTTRRFEDYGNSYKYRYVHHLHFPGIIYTGEFKGLIATLTFCRGEFFTGQNFCSACSMRKIDGVRVPLWAQVWDLSSSQRQGRYKWQGLDLKVPELSPIIDDCDREAFKKLHVEFKELWEKSLIQVEVDSNENINDEL